jgi:glycosyltransferase involved in cell wall biosynthesis
MTPMLTDDDLLLTPASPLDASPLRIAVFTFSYAPFLTGIATGAHSRIKALLELGHHVALFHPAVDEQYSDEIQFRRMDGLDELCDNPRFTAATYPTKPHPLDRSHPEPKSFRHWNDSAMLDEFQPDVILVDEAGGMGGTSSLFWGGYGKAVGAEYAAKHGIPAIALFETDFFAYSEKHLGRLITRAFRPFIVPAIRRFHQNYVTTLFPSRVMMEKYATFGVAPSTYVGFHGINCDAFHPRTIQHDPLADDRRPTLLFIGRLVKEKSVEELFVVTSILRKYVPDIHLIIVGSGPDTERLTQLATAHPETFTMWGESFGDELKGLYARATVFLNPSSTENFCTTNLEAMACGTPVIAAEAGGNQEQVFDGINGFLSKPHDPTDMAKRALQVLQDDELCDNLATAARQWVMQYDIRQCVRRLDETIRSFLPATSSRPHEAIPDATTQVELTV